MHRQKEPREDVTTPVLDTEDNKSYGRGLRAAAQKFVKYQIYMFVCVCVCMHCIVTITMHMHGVLM